MIFLCISDLHDEDAAIGKLAIILNREKFDAVICCGDLENYSFSEQLFNLFKQHNLTCFAVFGNNDSQKIIDLISRDAVLLHRRTLGLKDFFPELKEISKLKIAGAGGAIIAGFNTIQEYAEDEFDQILSGLDVDENTILVTHTSPLGFFDSVKGKHCGSLSLKKFVEERKPLALICGHFHEFEGSETVESTVIAKVPPGFKLRALSLELPSKKVQLIDLHNL